MKSPSFLASLTILLAIASAFASEKVRYDGYKIYRVVPVTRQHFDMLPELQKSGVVFLEEPARGAKHVDILFPPHLQGDLLSSLRDFSGMKVTETVPDLQKLIDAEVVNHSKEVRFDWNAYQTFDKYMEFLDEQLNDHPGLVTVQTIGNSFEGRALKVLKIRKESDNFKPAIWIDSNIHAREWISGAVTTYVINQLLNGGSDEVKSWLDDFDWYFLPIANPDGFSFTHTGNRLWRKTRSTSDSILGCKGADPNRNFGYKWLTGGSSNVPCDDTYAGSEAFSEIEVQKISEYFTAIASDVKCFISIHSYSQFVIFPYGLLDEALEPEEYAEYVRIATKVADGLATQFETKFQVGSITDLLYPASGGSIDWIKHEFNTALTFAMELRDTGAYGFLLPANQIIPSGQEFMDGLRVFVEELRIKFPPTNSSKIST